MKDFFLLGAAVWSTGEALVASAAAAETACVGPTGGLLRPLHDRLREGSGLAVQAGATSLMVFA